MAIPYSVHIPFISHLGIALELFENGQSRMVYELRPEHANSFGVAHGGMLMTMLDVTMASAARSVDKEMGVITIEMKTSFMRPGQGRLTSNGRLIQRTRSLAFVEATIHDAGGGVCAHGTGTFKYVKQPAGGPNTAIPTD